MRGKEAEEFVRVVAAEVRDEEREFDAALRPKWLSEFVGQPRVKEQFQLLVEGGIATALLVVVSARPAFVSTTGPVGRPCCTQRATRSLMVSRAISKRLQQVSAENKLFSASKTHAEANV